MFLANITQTGEISAYVEDYFQSWINRCLVLSLGEQYCLPSTLV